MLHAHGGVQEFQGPLRQIHLQAAEERDLLNHDPWTLGERRGEFIAL